MSLTFEETDRLSKVEGALLALSSRAERLETRMQIRFAVRALLVVVRQQLTLTAEIKRSFVALATTMFTNDPQLKARYNEQWESLANQNDGSTVPESLQKIEAVIKELDE